MRRAAMAAGAALILSTASCSLPFGSASGSAGDTPAGSASPAPSPTAFKTQPVLPGQPYDGAGAAWVSPGIKPVSLVRAVGGAAVVMGVEGKDVFLFGLDPASGARKWTRLVSLSVIPTPFGLRFVVLDGGRVAYLDRASAADTPAAARLVILDPTGSGRQVAASEPMPFGSEPWPCEDDESTVCADLLPDQGTLRLRQDGTSEVLKPRPYVRIDPRTGRDLWRVPLGAVADGAWYAQRRVEGGVTITSSSGTLFVSLPDGKVGPVPTATAAAPGWGCEETGVETSYVFRAAAESGGWVVRDGVQCAMFADGKPGAPVTLPIPDEVGAHIGDMVVVGTAKGVIGYRQVAE